jgi:hypothetical protein
MPTHVPSALNVWVFVPQAMPGSSVNSITPGQSVPIPFASRDTPSQVPRSSGANVRASSPQPITLAKRSAQMNPIEERMSTSPVL